VEEKIVQFSMKGEEIPKGNDYISEGINSVVKSQNVTLKNVAMRKPKSLVKINCETAPVGVSADDLICSGPVQAPLSAENWVGKP